MRIDGDTMAMCHLFRDAHWAVAGVAKDGRRMRELHCMYCNTRNTADSRYLSALLRIGGCAEIYLFYVSRRHLVVVAERLLSPRVMCRAPLSDSTHAPALDGGGEFVCGALDFSSLANASAIQLLVALSRAGATAELLTGKSELHWQRALNASWRAYAVRERAAAAATKRSQINTVERVGVNGFGTTSRLRRALRRVAAQHRRHAPRRAGAAALAEVRRLREAPSLASSTLLWIPNLEWTHQASWRPTPPASAAVHVLARARIEAATDSSSHHGGVKSAALTTLPTPVVGALPTGHPLLVMPHAPDGVLRRLESHENREFLAMEKLRAMEAGITVASDAIAAAASARHGTFDAAAIDAAAEAQVAEEHAAQAIAAADRLPVNLVIGLGVSCGGFSGALSRAIVHPLDTLRVLQSVSSTSASAEIITESAIEVSVLQRLSAASEHYAQTGQRLLRDARQIGRSALHNWHLGPASNPFYDTQQLTKSVRILYRGYGLSVFGAGPVYSLYFGAYEAGKLKLAEAAPSLSSSLVQIMSGFFAECCAVIVWNPWEVVRQRMQLETAPKTFLQTTRDIIAESGARGLYAGIGGYIALWGCYSPLMFLLYEQGMGMWYQPRDAVQFGKPPAVIVPSLATSFCMGSFAGLVASVITSPLDVRVAPSSPPHHTLRPTPRVP